MVIKIGTGMDDQSHVSSPASVLDKKKLDDDNIDIDNLDHLP